MNGLTTRELRHELYVQGVQNEIIFVDTGDEFVYVIDKVTHEPLEATGGNLTIRCSVFDHTLPPRELDPLTSMDDRASVAESMLDQYSLLRSNLKIREAIHRQLHDRQGSPSERTRAAYDLVVQAQAELDQVKYEILSLMGVDS